MSIKYKDIKFNYLIKSCWIFCKSKTLSVQWTFYQSKNIRITRFHWILSVIWPENTKLFSVLNVFISLWLTDQFWRDHNLIEYTVYHIVMLFLHRKRQTSKNVQASTKLSKHISYINTISGKINWHTTWIWFTTYRMRVMHWCRILRYWDWDQSMLYHKWACQSLTRH